jgi:hypothetical protein
VNLISAISNRGKLFKKWLEENQSQIEVYYLPSYTPERDPDEYFNGTLKSEIEKHGDCKKAKRNSSRIPVEQHSRFKTIDKK